MSNYNLLKPISIQSLVDDKISDFILGRLLAGLLNEASPFEHFGHEIKMLDEEGYNYLLNVVGESNLIRLGYIQTQGE